MKVWVVTGRTESGDAVGPYVWGYNPSKEEIENLLKEYWPDEYEECNGVSWVMETAEVCLWKRRRS